MSVNYNANGFLIIPEKARIWGHILNENYTLLLPKASFVNGDIRYFNTNDYLDASEVDWFLYFKSESSMLNDEGQALTSLQKVGTLGVSDSSWFRTDSAIPWKNPLVLNNCNLSGDIYYNEGSITHASPKVVSEVTDYVDLVSGDPTTQLKVFPLVTAGGSLVITGGDLVGTDYVLVAYINSTGAEIVPSLQGARVVISLVPLTGNEVSAGEEIYVYLSSTELQLSYTSAIVKTFSIAATITVS